MELEKALGLEGGGDGGGLPPGLGTAISRLHASPTGVAPCLFLCTPELLICVVIMEPGEANCSFPNSSFLKHCTIAGGGGRREEELALSLQACVAISPMKSYCCLTTYQPWDLPK